MHPVLNLSLLVLGIALQLALVVLLWRRGLARQLPFFTILIAFYAMRSLLLYVLSGHLSRTSMAATFNTLSVLDSLLQVALLAHIALALMREGRGWAWSRLLSLTGVIGLAILGGITVGSIWPPRGRVSIDRIQIALALLSLLLFAWSALSRMHGPLRRVLEGLAAANLMGSVVQIAHYRTALARNASAYAVWFYVAGAVYLLVVLYWIVRVRTPGDRYTWSDDVLASHRRQAPWQKSKASL